MDEILELLLHPVRWQIVQHLAQEPLTPRQMQEKMPDVTQATVYRQLRTLTEAELLAVAGEEHVRGAVERTYGLGAKLDLASRSSETRRGQSALILALLQSDVDAYLGARSADDPLEGFTLTRSVLHMSDEERLHLQSQLLQLLKPFLTPHPGARPHALGVILAPQESEEGGC